MSGASVRARRACRTTPCPARQDSNEPDNRGHTSAESCPASSRVRRCGSCTFAATEGVASVRSFTGGGALNSAALPILLSTGRWRGDMRRGGHVGFVPGGGALPSDPGSKPSLASIACSSSRSVFNRHVNIPVTAGRRGVGVQAASGSVANEACIASSN
jgi:hypothetical protein